MPREYRQRLLNLSREWASKTFPGETVEFMASLHDVSAIPSDVLDTFGIEIFERSFPRAHVLIVRKDEVVLAQVREDAQPRHVHTLLWWREMLLKDPIRADSIKGKPIRLIFVSGVKDIRIRASCEEHGIEYLEL